MEKDKSLSFHLIVVAILAVVVILVVVGVVGVVVARCHSAGSALGF